MNPVAAQSWPGTHVSAGAAGARACVVCGADLRALAALVAGDLKFLIEPTAELRSLLQDGRVLARRLSAARDEPAAGKNADATRPRRSARPRPQGSLFPRW